MEWWHWLLLGLILVALEMAAAGGFYVIFFGVAALFIGGLHLFGLAGPVWWQVLLFSILSIASLLVFRGPVVRWLRLDAQGADVDSLLGELAVPLEDIPPGGVGRAELRGSAWSARNASAAPVLRGQRCTVARVEELLIFIEPEGGR